MNKDQHWNGGPPAHALHGSGDALHHEHLTDVSHSGLDHDDRRKQLRRLARSDSGHVHLKRLSLLSIRYAHQLDGDLFNRDGSFNGSNWKRLRGTGAGREQCPEFYGDSDAECQQSVREFRSRRSSDHSDWLKVRQQSGNEHP